MYSKQASPSLPKHFAGKWHGKSYTILRELGKGANGTVYLASTSQGKQVAIKIGMDALDLFMEVNMLREIKPAYGIQVGPFVVDVDDLILRGASYTYYAMEFVDGEQLDHYVKRVGVEWVPVLMIQLLTRLQIFHSQGWIFGDLKPENILVVNKDKQLRLIDFGGVTRIGNAVRQFTEEYDRAAWHSGDRKASVSYDLFSLAIMMTRLVTGEEGWKKIRLSLRTPQVLCDIIRDNNDLYPYRKVLAKALEGKYQTAIQMRQDMVGAVSTKTHPPVTPDADRVGKWIGGLFAASLLLLAGSLYYLWM